jgi:broad specificity phosphatase PhoE
MSKIILVRHGHVHGIAPERFRGRQDLPLTDLALSTAQRIRATWKIASVYSSPLSRSLATAQVIAEACGTEVHSLSELTDIDYGEWQGLTPQEVGSRWPAPFNSWRQAPHLVEIPGGESLAEVTARVTRGLGRILSRHRNEAVVVVGHDSVNRLLLLWALDLPASAYWHLRQEPCAINELDFAHDRFQLATMNETWHLRDSV